MEKQKNVSNLCSIFYCRVWCKKLLDFVEQNDEHPVPVAEMITKSLSSHSLDIKNVSAYSADNASVNYGSRQSLFTELKALNGRLVKANCNARFAQYS